MKIHSKPTMYRGQLIVSKGRSHHADPDVAARAFDFEIDGQRYQITASTEAEGLKITKEIIRTHQHPTRKFFAGMQEQVFRPCTAGCERMTPDELRYDCVNFIEMTDCMGSVRYRIKSWFDMRVLIEEMADEVECDAKRRIKLISGLRRRYREYLARCGKIKTSPFRFESPARPTQTQEAK